MLEKAKKEDEKEIKRNTKRKLGEENIEWGMERFKKIKTNT